MVTETFGWEEITLKELLTMDVLVECKYFEIDGDTHEIRMFG